MFTKTRHTTCISPSLGDSGNPSVITARGIVCAIQVPPSTKLLHLLPRLLPPALFSRAHAHVHLTLRRLLRNVWARLSRANWSLCRAAAR